jgi:mRNA-degrading endonuclease RelE of RelBE toxin-antitoxin system
MKRVVVQTKLFSDELDTLVDEKKLLEMDYQELEGLLLDHPEFGDLIKGTGGIRKTRLKSSTKGKRGGFRVCYYDFPEGERLYFIIIYGKNEKEEVSNEDKTYFKKILEKIKKEAKNKCVR